MINIAFVKFAGLSGGGTEKYLQTLAANLPKDRFSVDYYYTEAVPLIGNSFIHPATDSDRYSYMKDNNINLIEVGLDARDDRSGKHSDWVNTNFFEIFDPSKYDIIQTGRFGYKEFPFYKMDDCIFVDSIHSGGQCSIEHRENIKATVLLSKYHVGQGISNGGDESKIKIIPPIVECPANIHRYDARQRLGIPKDTVVFGMHQRVCDIIFSSIPIDCFKKLSGNVSYVIMGGSDRYRSQYSDIGNVFFVDFSTRVEDICSFLDMLDVYSHGRSDGEVCSASIIEALKNGLPVISHSALNNGHQEQIEGCGFFVNSKEEYLEAMTRLLDKELRLELGAKATKKYKSVYGLKPCIEEYVKLYEEILDPQID